MGIGRLDQRESHKAAAGQKSTAAAEAIGRSRGGLTTKVHAAVDALGNGLRLDLTLGQWTDSPQLPGAVVDDKAYDTNAVLAAVARCGAHVVIPPKASRLDQRANDQNLYADSNKVEWFFGRLKEARGFATRYEKAAFSFLAVAHLLAVIDWLR